MSGSTLLSKDGAALLTRGAPKCKDVRAGGRGWESGEKGAVCVCSWEVRQVYFKAGSTAKFIETP